jgi:DNA invertase Pin-like site-specific DNA recombinase
MGQGGLSVQGKSEAVLLVQVNHTPKTSEAARAGPGSYETQGSYYEDYIKKRADWEFAGIHADEGITGTNTKHRAEFIRMIDDCLAGRIDLVVTKSIS